MNESGKSGGWKVESGQTFKNPSSVAISASYSNRILSAHEEGLFELLTAIGVWANRPH